MSPRIASCVFGAMLAVASAAAQIPPASSADDRAAIAAAAGAKLRAAYPEHIAGIDTGALVWRDGTRMPLDDGTSTKPFEAWLATPDLKDMFRLPYPAGAALEPPPAGDDPGRARNTAFFAKMYGDCRKGEVDKHLVDVTWLPSRSSAKLKVTRINGIAGKLSAISAELDALPASFNIFLLPPAGAFNCRTIAGTDQASAHSYGIAIDIAIKNAHYWRWSKARATKPPLWRNAIPREIVDIFERHGFIWGGRWSHYDTMHFEYRPELLVK
jgi:D-alanyl-D-alanine carboxypeptidase